MIGVLDGDYGSAPTITIPGGLPGSGTYSTVDLAIQALISAASTELNNLPTQYSSYYANANEQFTIMCDHIVLELQTLADADIDMSTTTGNRQGIMSFAGNIHTYATQTEKYGAAEILERISDTSNSSGEAMIAALREGRNIDNLQSSGVGMDNIPPQAGNTEPGNISTGAS